MAKFRKKPVVIDAVQYHGDDRNETELLAHLEGCTGWHVIAEGIAFPTPEGTMTARPGDWIVRGVKGEFYPCKSDIFALTYEAV